MVKEGMKGEGIGREGDIRVKEGKEWKGTWKKKTIEKEREC